MIHHRRKPPPKATVPPSFLPTLKGLVDRFRCAFQDKYGHWPSTPEEDQAVTRAACAEYDMTVKMLRKEGYMLDPGAVSMDGLTQDIKKIAEGDYAK